jgi:uncharacterized LabA/DUF88 family protein
LAQKSASKPPAPAEPAKKYAMAFVDGQNLFRHAKDAFGHYHPNYDPIKLHKAVCEKNGWIPTLVNFYTGVPDEAHSLMWARYWSNRVLALKRAGVNVTTRKIRYRTEFITLPDGVEHEYEVAQEKGIDVRIALDLVRRARTKEFNVAVLYTQDQDLAEVVQEVKLIAAEQNRWILVACAFPAGPLASTLRGINGAHWFEMEKDFYDACLDPRDFRPRRA